MSACDEDMPPDLVIAGLARRSGDLVHGSYTDVTTTEVECLAAGAVRYLNYAAMRSG